jgi:hypothetical protein
MDPRDMAYTGKGEYFPKVKPKRQTDSVARNRRIEIVVLAPGVDDKDMPANKQEVTKLRTTTSKAEKSVAAPVPGAREALDAEIQGSFADAVVSTSQ